MVAKRRSLEEQAIAEAEVMHHLTVEEACKALQVAPSADEELIAQAYWHHAGKLRVMAAHDPEARARLDELNRAFLVLNPARTEAPLTKEAPPEEPRFDFVAWLGRLIEQTRARWPGHVEEVAMLSVTTALLTFLALSAGASPLWTLITAGIAALAIWAPWRRA